MARQKSDKSGFSEKASDFAKSIWLAGIGAYGKSYDGKEPDIFPTDLPKTFANLVKKGEAIEAATKQQKKSAKTLPSAENFEARMRRVRESFGLPFPSLHGDSKKLEEKLDTLIDEVAELKRLVAQNQSPPRKKAAAKTKASRPTTARRSRTK